MSRTLILPASIGLLFITIFAWTLFQSAKPHPARILNVSYDLSRHLYQVINAAFQAQVDQPIVIKQSHASAGKQTRALLDGLPADVITLNQSTDMMLLAQNQVVSEQWKQQFPNNASPYTSTVVFVVRKNNPHNIQTWADLLAPKVQIITPHPKVSGSGRYAYLAAHWQMHQLAQQQAHSAEALIQRFLKNIRLFANGGRDATSQFIQQYQGDVLLTLESEAYLIQETFGHQNVEIVYPPQSILVEFPVATHRNLSTRAHAEIAHQYLAFLWSDEAQTIFAKMHLRPQNPRILKHYQANFPEIETHSVHSIFGSWQQAMQPLSHGGSFDQMYYRLHQSSLEF